MEEYNLKDHGSPWEKEWCFTVCKNFINYETFWQKFIASDLTNRPNNIGLKNNLDPIIEEMVMSHYSVFIHIAKSHWLFSKYKEESENNDESKKYLIELYSDIFFHLGATTEMAERFVFNIWEIGVKIGEISDLEPIEISDYLLNLFKKYFNSKNYKKYFDRYLETGQSIIYPLHSIRDIQNSLGKYLKNDQAWGKTINKFYMISDQKIRRYRNFLTHNPIIGSIKNDDKIYLPKHNKLSDYRYWSSILYKPESFDHFILVDDLIEKLISDIEKSLDSLWIKLINIMEKFSSTSNYMKLINVADMEISPILNQILGDVLVYDSHSFKISTHKM